MIVIQARNVHQALPETIRQLALYGVDRESRNGPVTVFPYPTTIHYLKPRERVLFWRERDANPFFHFFEGLWMIAGRNDVKFPASFAKNIRNYSDDGKTLHGAYGHRWRRHFKMDQLKLAVMLLKENRDNRRVYVEMWDARVDFGLEGKDFPCNVGLTLQVNHNGELDMVVHNRSNDIVWGALGANAVHFSMMQEYVASSIGVPVGGYWQVSSNMHGYHATLEKVKGLADKAADFYTEKPLCPYQTEIVHPYNMCNVEQKVWDEDLGVFLEEGPIVGFRDPFFRRVVTPLWLSHKAYKQGDFKAAKEVLQQCSATDWAFAATDWITRREREADDGPAH